MSFRLSTIAMGWAMAVLCTGLARADELGEVTRLQEAGQNAAALQRAETFLVDHPRDARMRFQRATLLADSGRRDEAITALENLIQDFPDLAEPHNNLAALYAAAGRFGPARTELEEALRLRPGYATAHENLADVYAALAAQSYATALRLDPGRAGVPAKLALVRQLPGAASAPAAGGTVRR